MKTPKEKAEELVNKMYFVDDPMGNYPMCFAVAKKCALIAVNEIIKALRKDLPEIGLGKGYWKQVEQEIKKL